MNAVTELFIITGVFIVVTIGFGSLFAWINKRNSKWIHRDFGWGGICFFGWIGVPVHECSHLIMAILFHHKITAVSLFRPRKGKQDGVLGYVRHTYRNTTFQKMGNFFIGAAPMITGAFLIRWMIGLQTESVRLPALSFSGWQGIVSYAKEAVSQVWSIFHMENMGQVSFWMILICIIGIAVNMNMSSADVRNSMHGIFSLFLMTAVLPFVIHVAASVSYERMAVLYMGLLMQYISVLIYAIVICSMIWGLMYLLSYLF